MVPGRRLPSPRLRRIATPFLAVALAFGAYGGTPGRATAAELILSPQADSWIDSSLPNSNAGTQKRLKVRTATTKRFETYLRFVVAGAGSIQEARLRLFVADASPDGGSLFATSDAWTEGGLTWNNRPPTEGAALAHIGPAPSSGWVEADVSAEISGDGTYSFVLTGGVADTVTYHSRESSAAKRPQLVITTAGEPPPSAPVNIATPTVSPAGPERAVHFARPGSWTGGDPMTFAYQWHRCDAGVCEPISGATTERYELATEDLGSGLRVEVTASNSAGTGTAFSSTTAPIEPMAAPAPGDPVVAVAGDIACDPDSSGFAGGVGTGSECRQFATSELLAGRGLSGVLIPGDVQYNFGEYDDFLRSYDVSWGRVNGITYPAPGNHEYGTADAAGYFRYFGASGGTTGQGWYSFDVGDWHLIALNSNCNAVACEAGSPQEQWLRQDLAANAAACTLAYWHHPRFSSGEHGDEDDVAAFWEALYEYGADVVLNGHDHDYERFAPQTPAGFADSDHGIREFVVGTGGKSLRSFGTPLPNSEARNATDFGVLDLTLHDDGYSWQFVPIEGEDYSDSGTGSCHGAPAGTPPPPPPPASDADFTVSAAVETKPVPHTMDSADDAAIWVHPTDPTLSTVIGTDKQPGGGLAVYDLSGAELHFYGGVAMNNVDLIEAFPLGGSTVSLVVATDRDNKAIAMFRVDPATRGLVNVASRLITEAGGGGICTYRSATTGQFYAFTATGNGVVKQWRLFDDGRGSVDASLVRKFDVGEATEGCVADEARAQFYVSEEAVGIWRYGAEPTDTAPRVLVDGTGADGHLTADVEGLALVETDPRGGAGYLVASSQGDDRYVIYRRDDYAFVGSFRIVPSGTIDGAESTDGIDITATSLGPRFPGGVFVAQDGNNTDGGVTVNHNFKLVRWDEILRAAGEAN